MMEKIVIKKDYEDSQLISALWKHNLQKPLTAAAMVLSFLAAGAGALYLLLVEFSLPYFLGIIIGFVLLEALLIIASFVFASYSAQVNAGLLGDDSFLELDEGGISAHIGAEIIAYTWNDIISLKRVKGFYLLSLRQYPVLHLPVGSLSAEAVQEMDSKIAEKGLAVARTLKSNPIPSLPEEQYAGAVSVVRFVRSAKDMYRFYLYYLFFGVHILVYDTLLLLLCLAGVFLMLYLKMNVLVPVIVAAALLLVFNIIIFRIAKKNALRSGDENTELILLKDRIVSRDFLGMAQQYWSQLVAIRVTRNYYYCFLTAQAAIVVPKEELTEEGLELLEDKIYKFKLDERKLADSKRK